MVLGERMIQTAKACNGCGMCCYFLPFPGSGSVADKMCKHFSLISGCTKYEKRPDSCSEYQCLWMKDYKFPMNIKPDVCGVMFDLPKYAKTIIAYVDPARPYSHQTITIITMIRALLNVGRGVMVYRGKRHKRIFFVPRGATEMQLRGDLMNAHKKHIADGGVP